MNSTINNYLKRILTASVYDIAIETPLDLAANLSSRLKNKIFLKREDLQPVFSFKLRGAYNKMANLSAEALKKGVITASAGNHAQGVALSAKTLNCEATIVMPTTTPQIKINAVTSHGGNVVLFGESFNDAYTHAMQLVAQTGKTYIPPFDDPDVIAGQGTVALEILRQHPKKIDAIFIPIGGGGLAAGVAAYIKSILPEIKVIGVEPVDSDAMNQSIKLGKRIELTDVGLFADGVAVKLVGEETFRLCQNLLDDIILVNSDQICAAIKDIFEDTRSIAEPSGALALAGLKAYIEQHNCQDQNLVTVISGANMNFERLHYVTERSELGEQKEAIFAITIDERPGTFRNFCHLIGDRNITEFNYRYGDKDQAHIFVGIQTTNNKDVEFISKVLAKAHLPAINLTDNEIAKSHIRYMVGGRSDKIAHEKLISFYFPERPGALKRFLDSIKLDWNITLFHYRNHGADHGRVLVAIEVPKEEEKDLFIALDRLGYQYKDESNNLAYQLFLGSN
ncbi:threonine ammonia-lyase, biosynthetic [Neisseria sp. Ec49-e6-T10]|uniref:threonine ammonia-lyase, biosynthetic n=1 Tax=Neisseria sp. Ec49-e6-T10 TaxID=3140744 RepID=UPI003EBD63F7